MILGDSFTFGMDVNDDETYPYYLQKSLPKTEVLNFGVPGYGHDQMLVLLNEEGYKYKPDMIVLTFIAGDMNRNTLEFFLYAKPKFDLVDNKLVLTNSRVSPPSVVLRNLHRESRFLDLCSIARAKIFNRSRPSPQAITVAILNAIAGSAARIGAKLFIVYPLVPNEKLDSADVRFISGYCKQRRIAFGAVNPFPYGVPPDEDFTTDRHWSLSENRFVALGLKRLLIEQRLILP